MRIALVLGQVGGGVLSHVRALAATLSADGHQVVVAAPAAVLARVGAVDGLPVAIGERPDPIADARTVRAVRGLAGRVDVVHAHGVRAAALCALARIDAPLVTTLHNAAPAGSLLTAGVFALLLRVAARGSRMVLAVSPDLQQAARQAGARDVRRAVVAADPAPLLLGPSSDPVEPVPRAANCVQVVCLARLASQKRIDLLIETASLTGAGVDWVVAGDGPEQAALQAQIDRTDAPVRLLGHCAEAAALLAASDLAVSTAVWEGQPVWLQEAVRAGLPVVAFDVGGIRETIGAAAVYADFPDVRTLAAEVRRLADDPAYRADRAARSRSVASTLPTARDQADALIGIYRSLLPPAMP